MLYAIVGQDVSDSLNLRLAARPAHVDRLQALHQAGRFCWPAPSPRSTATTPAAPAFPAA
jgi:hypothetical protein